MRLLWPGRPSLSAVLGNTTAIPHSSPMLPDPTAP